MEFFDSFVSFVQGFFINGITGYVEDTVFGFAQLIVDALLGAHSSLS